MEIKIIWLNAKQLAVRWNLSVKTLRKWRSLKKGPPFYKISGHASYKLEDIEEFERSRECKKITQPENE
jgi:hypothetical protein